MAVQQDQEMLQTIRSRFVNDLRDFAASSQTFKVLQRVSRISDKSTARSVSVVDSSFNPPSRAHLKIATTALDADPSSEKFLLLLLATQNADKTIKPAAFEDRLVMMTLMANDLNKKYPTAVVDVGITKEPFFHKKASCIDSAGTYAKMQQTHAVGFDSLLRIFDKKYYGEEGFEVIRPFLEKHKVRATLRTDDEWGDEAEQRGFVNKILDGSREEEGIPKAWGESIELVPGKSAGEVVVSSTQAREAAQVGDRTKLERMVIGEIADYVLDRGLYKDSKL